MWEERSWSKSSTFNFSADLRGLDHSHCAGCATETDFVSIDVASDLFEMKASEMLDVLKIGNCHLRADTKGNGLICLNSLIQSMKAEEGLTDGCLLNCMST